MTDMNDEVSTRVEVDDDGVLNVTLARPRRRNALDWDTFDALGTAFGDRAHRADVRCVVLRGEGPGFCGGLDRGILATLGGSEQDVETGGVRLQAAIDAMEACPRPTLAVVQGACVGGGMALLLACDFRIAASDAFFSMMEMRYAFVPDLGHVHRLQREVGLARAKEAIFFGGRLDAPQLCAWGVLNEVVAADELDVTAARWIERMRCAPPLAVREAKRIMQADPGGQDGTVSQREALRINGEVLLRSDDFREGLTASMEGREPRFRGR